ncbi:SDR family NAD(P)-dependent oxidoreductase [Catellatospora sp. KI3]|uniref:SDR family NAD(P)-dependent oxidoreductase n=1 Tax=Catellatospora sp. KI3 TaxID=3041620 RepID=UPI0024822ABD|nr:SDR family NAD(P)-dependent oxidoreductase [Catellatospora sp. KI3]MDI1465932.1 SDR family NAD(P)-dependent oxidoreductase [Catellatospora sp. KI3]
MSSVFVTGSADGIGLETARALLRGGHRVVLHARSEARAAQVRTAVPDAAAVVVGDVSELTRIRALALAANALGPYDAVIHNVGVGGGAARREATPDGIERILAINVLAPYLLTALMPPPRRLVYLTSGLEAGGRPDFADPQYTHRPWQGMQAYSDSKMYDVVLAFAVARLWPGTLSNAVDPGWIKTRMGGPNATDELPDGAETQVWLATAPEAEIGFTGRYLKRRQDLKANPAAYDESVQDRLLALCAELTGQELPR